MKLSYKKQRKLDGDIARWKLMEKAL